MNELLIGGCLCGDVRYASTGEPVFSGNCHCRDCQRTSGGAYTPALFVQTHTVKTSGTIKYYESTADSGSKITRGFCPNCGSQLFARLERMPDLLGIRAGTLDDPSMFKPVLDMFTASASHWDVMNPDLPKFLKAPNRT